VQFGAVENEGVPHDLEVDAVGFGAVDPSIGVDHEGAVAVVEIVVAL